MADVVKYGIQIPNNVFVGGVAFDTKEEDLKEFFKQYGKVEKCKIIKDNQHISRGFAFVTFECKHDAIQTQQLGTVFFNQKKLNLAPAIRQKGVVFNGAKEVENEPVLSTGVYIHPSGYSYTVAPNGVWYFHNADGTPPSSMPGSPPMCYAPSVMQKTNSGSRRGSAELSISTNESNSPPTMIESHSPPTDVHHIPTAQVFQTPVCQPPSGSFVQTHPAMGSSNVHLAFQNLSVSPHIHGGMPSNHSHQLAPNTVSAQSFIPNMNSHIQNFEGMVPAGPGQPITYSQIPEGFVSYYPGSNKMIHHLNGVEHRQMHQPLSGHYSIPLPKNGYCSVVRPEGNVSLKSPTVMYPFVGDVYQQQTFIYPPIESTKMMVGGNTNAHFATVS